MRLRGIQTTLTVTLHVLNALVDVIVILLIMGFGAVSFGTRFQRHSIDAFLLWIMVPAVKLLRGQAGGSGERN